VAPGGSTHVVPRIEPGEDLDPGGITATNPEPAKPGTSVHDDIDAGQ